MSISVLTASRSSNLVSLDQVKSWLRITGEEEDALLRSLIGVASAAIHSAWEAMGCAPLARQRFEESRSGDGKTLLYLSGLPVAPETLSVEIDGEAVTDWTVQSGEWGKVYRPSGWTCSSGAEQNIEASYHGGYLLPDDVTTWSASAVVASGAFVRASDPSVVLRFECTGEGACGATEPTWPATAGQTVASGTATFTARTAWDLDPSFGDHAYGILLTRYQFDRPAGMTRFKAADVEATFSTETGALPDLTQRFLERKAAGKGIRA